MRNLLAGLTAALRLLTRVPVPGPETRPEHLPRAVAWFPLVGALVGLATAGILVLALRWWPAPVAAALAVGAGLLLTGGFHEDGAADAADGLGGGWTRERTVEIMRDSRIGSYGAMALWLLLTFRWAVLQALGRSALVALPLAMVWGRWSMVALMTLLPSASPGLSSRVARDLGWKPLAGATLLLALANLAGWALGVAGLWKPAAAALAVLACWACYLRRRLGGQTGDLLGAGNQLVEAAVLLLLLVR